MRGKFAAIPANLVKAALAHSRIVAAAALLLGVFSVAQVIRSFEIRTDLDSLLSSDLPWRRDARELERAFPGQGDDITVVVDAATPELADGAAAALTSLLSGRADLFASVERYNGGPFFDREGLLFLSLSEVRSTTAGLIAAQPLLGPIAADPSLRGLMTSLVTAIDAADANPTQLAALVRPMNEVEHVLSEREAGRPAFLSWRGLVKSEPAVPSDWRQYVEILPHLDYSNPAPAAAAVAAIRRSARDLHLTPQQGVTIRISGSAPIADEELATLSETTGPVALLMLASIVGILYWGVGSWRTIAAILLTVATGAAITSAFGLLMFHNLNLISVAFLPLFVGLSVDFAIQFAVRARAENVHERDLTSALTKVGAGIGGALTLASAAVAAAFFAFLPTTYRGVAELGMIAGVGMVIAIVLTLTLLPATLALIRARASGTDQGLRQFAAADRMVFRFRWLILATTLAAAALSIAVLPSLAFNFDPMRLKSPRYEAMATYLELARSAETTPNTLNVLSPDLATANRTARTIAALPEVAEALTLSSFLPSEQDAKLVFIQDAQLLLGPSLSPFDIAPAPTDAEDVASLRKAAARLRDPVNFGAPRDSVLAGALAASLDRVATQSAAARDGVRRALLAGLPTALAQFNASLSAEPIDLATIPPDLRRQWLDPSGRARIEVSPSRPLATRELTARFVRAVRRIAPNAAGDAATVVEAGDTILMAFLQAGALSTLMIAGILLVALRRFIWAALAIGPVMLSGLLTFATCAIFGIDINLENMIALPLLLGIGVAFNIYFVMARRDGETAPLKSSLARAVFFSALTTGTAFAALALSAHPGTSSMGVLLMIALFWILATTLIVLPALFEIAIPRPARDA